MLRRILAVLGPSAVLLLGALLLRPIDLGYLSFLLVIASPMLGAAGGFLIRPDPEEPAEPETSGWLVMLALLSAVTTAIFWFRVWQYDSWDLVSIPVKYLYIVGFWWPGVLLATLAWALAGPYVHRTLRRYTVVLAVGALASTVGAASYQIAYSTYYKAHDGQSLTVAMERLAGNVPGTMLWQHHRGMLVINVDCNWASEASPYTVYSSLAGIAQTAVLQLYRSDVSEVNVQVTANGLLLFTGNATDDAPGDPAEWIQRLDRSVLKNGGRIEQACLDEMAALVAGELPTAAEQAAFADVFHSEVAGSEVVVTFEPLESLSVENVGQCVVAYRLANRIITETAIYFPEIESFRINLAGKERVVKSTSVEPTSFYLQADLVPADKVLGLVVRDQSQQPVSIDPVSFKPNTPLDENQLAIVAKTQTGTTETAGRVFQPLLLGSWNVIITDVGTDGTATAFVLPTIPDEVPAGPISVAPGVEEIASTQWILNSGLLNRAAFPPSGSTPLN